MANIYKEYFLKNWSSSEAWQFWRKKIDKMFCLYIRLLSVNNVKELCNLGKYIFRVLSLRTNPICEHVIHYFCHSPYIFLVIFTIVPLCEDRSGFFFFFHFS